MDEAIEMFIRQSFIDSKADAFLESFEVFKNSSIPDYDLEFHSLLMEESALDHEYVLNAFEQLISSNLSFILRTHGIRVDDDTPIWLMNQICRGLSDIEYYLDPTEILLIVDSDLDKQEKLARVIQSVIGLDEHLSVVHFFDVSDSLIDKIREVFVGREKEPVEDVKIKFEQHAITRRLCDIIRFLGNDNFIGINLVKAGVYINAEFSNYFKYFERHLDDKDNKEIAKELFILICLSKNGMKNVMMTYSAHSALLFHDLDKTSKIYSEINSLVATFDRYMLQRSSLVHSDKKIG